MKSLQESLLDDDDKLFDDTDVVKNIAKTMPKKSDTVKIGSSGSPAAYYLWRNPLFEKIINHRVIKIDFFSETDCNKIYFESVEETCIYIKVRDENKYKATKKKAEAYETLVFIKDNLQAFAEYLQEFEKSRDYIKFDSLEDFKKEILK